MTTTRIYNSLLGWVDNDAYTASGRKAGEAASVDWVRVVPFFGLHVACLSVLLVGWSTAAVIAALVSYFIRMFAITGFYHRYFSHRSFKTSRPVQFVFALLGAAATQRGPIWWAAHHRHHHVNSDSEADCHSPRRGFWWSHVGWFLSGENFATRDHRVKDLKRFPELRWLDRFDAVVPVIYAGLLFLIGEWLAHGFPQLIGRHVVEQDPVRRSLERFA